MGDPALRKNDTAIQQTRKNASDVLAKHPTLKDLLPTSDQWHLSNLTSGVGCNTEKLLSELIDCLLEAAQRTGIKRAVQTCDKLLTDAAERKLSGYELTFLTASSSASVGTSLPAFMPFPTGHSRNN